MTHEQTLSALCAVKAERLVPKREQLGEQHD